MNDGKSYASIIRDPQTGLLSVVKSSYEDGRILKVLYTEKDLIYKEKSLEPGTEFSPDETKVLLLSDEESVYRHSTKANYFILDLNTRSISPLSEAGKQSFPTFSPDGRKIAFVRDNNIFIRDLASEKEQQISFDGKRNSIINGQSDWVYEEEFSFPKAFFWSPDSKKIAYYRFDESAVKEYCMTMYNLLYPTAYCYKYPKAGEKNSKISILIYHLDKQKTIQAETGEETDQYIPRVKWTSDPNALCILRMNRHQNKLDYLISDASTGKSTLILSEKDPYYIDIEQERLTFLKNGKQFINTSERDGYNHLYLYDMNGKILKQLTDGNWEVTEVYGVDEKTNTLYYQSSERSPLQRDIYSVSLDGKRKKRLSDRAGTNSATFSSDFSYFILEHSTLNSPAFISLNNSSGKQIRVLEDNARLTTTLRQYNFSPANFFQLKTTEGTDLNGYMIRPADFNPARKYPVMMYVYGGPGSQSVADMWAGSRQLWFNMLAQKGYIVVCVDNRGTGFRGAEFKKQTYKQLGRYETIDQLEAAKWLAAQPYIDAGRIGIWGWSFGGYLTSLCLTKGAGLFKMGIAVAPVTNWRFYDTIYTERYLRTPQENPEGYDENSPVNFAGQLQGKFLLVHGTGDDNVHFQNSVVFSEALIQANKAFEQAYYPNKAHGISGGNTTMHLYSRLTDFITNNL